MTYNPSTATYESLGYMPIVQADCPCDGQVYKVEWEEENGKIMQRWVVDDTESEPSLEEQILQTQMAVAELAELIVGGVGND